MDIGQNFFRKSTEIKTLPKDVNKLIESEPIIAEPLTTPKVPEQPDVPVLPPVDPKVPKNPPPKPELDKFAEWLDSEYIIFFRKEKVDDYTDKPDVNTNNPDSTDDLLNDPLYIHSCLEPFRDTLYDMSYSSEKRQYILDELEKALKEHRDLSEVFENLLKELKYDYAEFMNAIDYEYAYKQVNADEIKQYIEDFCNAIKNHLINDKGYDESYADTIANFLKQKVNITGNNINLKEVLTNINNIAKELTGNTNLQGFRFTNNINFWELNSILNDENKKQEYIKSGLQNEFFIYMIDNAYNFENEQDKIAFLHKLFMQLNEKGGFSNEFEHNYYTDHSDNFYIDISKYTTLDKNDDGSWLDEFYSIINQLSASLEKTSDYNSARTIDTNILFGDKNELSPADITNMLNDMYFSQDEGVVKLRALLNKAFNRFNIDNFYDEAEIITDIMKKLNNEAGIGNTKPVKLTKEVMDKLNDGTLFDIIEKYINSDELREEYYFGIDDEFDLYSEGRTSGACWAIAALTSLNNSPVGQQMIKEALTFNDDGSVTVTFKGAGKSYTITRDEIEHAKNNSSGLSYGDNTILVILMATEKLRKDLDVNGNVEKSTLTPNDPGYWVYGGLPSDLIEWLTGKTQFNSSNSFINKQISNILDRLDEQTRAYLEYLNIKNGNSDGNAESELNNIINQLYDIPNIKYTKRELFELLKPGLISGDVILNLITVEGYITITTQPDGEKKTFEVGNHAWGVKEVTEDTITFWDLYKQEEYTVNIDDLLQGKDFIFVYTILNDDYEISEEYTQLAQNLNNIDINEFVNYDNSNITRDKTTFNNDMVYSTDMTIEEVLDSPTPPPCSLLRYQNALQYIFSKIQDPMIIAVQLRSIILINIMNYIDTIYTNIPNYTDFVALNNARTETLNYFTDIISIPQLDSDQIASLAMMKTSEEIFEFLGIDINIKTIFEKFLSYLPG